MSNQPPVKISRVVRIKSRAKIAPYVLGFGVMGTAVFAALASGRAEREEQATALPPLQATTIAAPAPPPPATIAETSPPAAISLTSVPPPPPPAVLVPRERPVYFNQAPAAGAARPENDAASRARARASAPALVVDLGPTKTSELPFSPMGFGRPFSPAGALFLTASMQEDPVGASIAAAGPPADAPVSVAPVSVAPVGVAPVVVGTTESTSARDLNDNERFASHAGNR